MHFMYTMTLYVYDKKVDEYDLDRVVDTIMQVVRKTLNKTCSTHEIHCLLCRYERST